MRRSLFLLLLFVISPAPLFAGDNVFIGLEEDPSCVHQDGWHSCPQKEVLLKPAYRYCHDVDGFCLVWNRAEVPVFLALDAPEEFERSLKTAIRAWNAAMGVELVYEGRRDFDHDLRFCSSFRSEAPEGIYVIPTYEGHRKYYCLDNSAGITWTLGYHTSLAYATVYVDLTGVNDLSQYLPTLMHELGHALGLDHPFDHQEDETFSIMNYNQFHSTVLTNNDVDVIQYLYGPSRTDEDFEVRAVWSLHYFDFSSGYPNHICILGGLPNYVVTADMVWDAQMPYCFYLNDTSGWVTITDANGHSCSFDASELPNKQDFDLLCSSAQEESNNVLVNRVYNLVFPLPTAPQQILRFESPREASSPVQFVQRYLGGAYFHVNFAYESPVYIILGIISPFINYPILWLKPDCEYGFEIVQGFKGMDCEVFIPVPYTFGSFAWLASPKDFSRDDFDWDHDPYDIGFVHLLNY